ncbi:MAG: hypothetical protein LPK80_00580 [Bacteroidota bacterium]|nr:hypothetical protein [Bacteroidota bacterium]MDX5428152.1 hypothetical protein [Bacteroidota bacterium]MDX5449047.1 hypothetical protein [Bacteroidota bacterium]MDX5505955.1 hypothetical protein [Bacteroidota bacterium]
MEYEALHASVQGSSRTITTIDTPITMNNLFIELKKKGASKFTRELPITPENTTPDGKLQLWTLLNELERSSIPPLQFLEEVAPHYRKRKQEVNLQLFDSPGKGDRLEMEGRFYDLGKRQVELRIFARIRVPNKRSIKVAKATYRISAIHINEVAKMEAA